MAITNLTNTSWIIMNDTAPHGFGKFNVNHCLVAGSVSETQIRKHLYVGYRYYDTAGSTIEFISDNYISSYLNAEALDHTARDEVFLRNGCVITFLGGNDVRNENLISWITHFAAQTEFRDPFPKKPMQIIGLAEADDIWEHNAKSNL